MTFFAGKSPLAELNGVSTSGCSAPEQTTRDLEGYHCAKQLCHAQMRSCPTRRLGCPNLRIRTSGKNLYKIKIKEGGRVWTWHK